jgi:hypothetical protein
LYKNFSFFWKGSFNHYVSFSPCFSQVLHNIIFTCIVLYPWTSEMWHITQMLLFKYDDCVWLNGCIEVSQNEDTQDLVWTLQHIHFLRWVCMSNITDIHKNLPTCAQKIPIAVWHKVIEKDLSLDTFWSDFISFHF